WQDDTSAQLRSTATADATARLPIVVPLAVSRTDAVQAPGLFPLRAGGPVFSAALARLPADPYPGRTRPAATLESTTRLPGRPSRPALHQRSGPSRRKVCTAL